MAFSFGNSNMGSPASGAGGNVQAGPDLEDIQTEVGESQDTSSSHKLLTF